MVSTAFRPYFQIVRESKNDIELLISPLEKHYAGVYANFLRSILLNNTVGTRITSVSIDGMYHEFCNIFGCMEDSLEVLENIKEIRFQSNLTGPYEVELDFIGPGKVLAGSFVCPEGLTVVNPDQIICTLNEFGEFRGTLLVEDGIGYVPSSSLFVPQSGRIYLDANFCPIKHVCYQIKHFTFYEELIFHIETTGAKSALELMKEALLFIRAKS
jgi:DNA-directed RNA polymerase subunit alpha